MQAAQCSHHLGKEPTRLVVVEAQVGPGCAEKSLQVRKALWKALNCQAASA
ncbi:unnamed protein product, partial [Gulo gulo]